MRDRETVAIDHQPYHHLLAVGPVIARIAALGLAVLGSKSLEIGRGEIVKVDRGVEIEQAALARNQCRLDSGAVRMQFVEHLIKRVFGKPLKVDIEDISERRAPDPVRHGVLGARRDQPIERHQAACQGGQSRAQTRNPMYLGLGPRREREASSSSTNSYLISRPLRRLASLWRVFRRTRSSRWRCKATAKPRSGRADIPFLTGSFADNIGAWPAPGERKCLLHVGWQPRPKKRSNGENNSELAEAAHHGGARAGASNPE